MNDIVKQRIDSYRKSEDKRPLIIDFSNLDDLIEFKNNHFSLHTQSVFSLSKPTAELPNLSDVYEFFGTCKYDECIVQHFGTLLKLFGERKLKENIHSLLSGSYHTKFIVITYQCRSIIEETIPKLKENILFVEGEEKTPSPQIIFVDSKYQNIVQNDGTLTDGLATIEGKEAKNVYVSTKYKKDDFPESLVSIADCRTPYDILCLKDLRIKRLHKEFGNDEQWSELLDKIEDNSIDKTIEKYIKKDNIIEEIKDWNVKSPFEKWLIFIYLKLNEINTDNWVINYAYNISHRADSLLSNIYNSLIQINHNDPRFLEKYKIWKQLLKDINDDTEIYDYCRCVRYKEKDALYYLTDNTDHEKKTIIDLISKYHNEYTRIHLLNVLKSVYHDLYDYLCDFNYGNEFLNSYFENYKYQKTANYLSQEFKQIVDEEARNRSFKKLLMHRTEKLDDIKLKDSTVFFVDALGAEYTSYIQRKCEEKDLSCKIHICQANLPTLTNKNIEFRDFFSKNNIEVIDEKRLDTLKHEGKSDYDYDKNKLPIHIVEELNIINECLDEIRKRIKLQKTKKAIIISDHGATRLAILNTEMIKEDVESTGEHGGRVCKYVEGMKEIPNAIVEDEYCILCDYNSFKGGRVGKVEMHGGATLEEVTIPLIEIIERDESIKVKVVHEVLKVSYKKKANLYFYTSKKVDGVSIVINGKTYKAETKDNMNFEVLLDDIVKSGKYFFDVWSNDQQISSENEFSIEKEVGSTNDLWG